MSSSEKQNQIISLTLVVDKKKQKVLYAEAGKDFVDVLLNFLTLPLATVSKLVSEESTNAQPCRFNCITSLHRSVEKMDLKYFFDHGDKERLLDPRIPVISYYQSIGLYNSHNTPFSKGFMGYLRQAVCYVVSDDLTVMPSEVETTFWMLRNFGVNCVTERLTVSVTQKEVVDLLKFSLWSKTPLTDLFLRKKLLIQNSGSLELSKAKINEVHNKVGARKKLKVVISKSGRKLLFAEADDDFMDQLLSFLTIPVAAVHRLEQGNSDLGCIDNLYKSCTNLDAARYFDPNMRDLKDKLLNPLIAPVKIRNQLLPIYPSGRETSCFQFIGDYVKRGTNFMVTDDLCVEPFSSPSAFSFLVESKVVDEQDLELMHLSVGVNEVFGILKAAMLSTSALTIGLRPLLTVKEDK